MNLLLMSIRPQYAEKILSGYKKYEYRKKLCGKPIDRIIIYATTPVKAIVGEVHVEGALSMPIEDLWDKTQSYAGIRHDAYKEYFINHKVANAYILGNVEGYLRPIQLKEIGVSVAPQSYQYISEEQYTIIKKIRGETELLEKGLAN